MRSTRPATGVQRRDDHRAVVAPGGGARPRRWPAAASWRSTAATTAAGERRVVGDQDRLGGGVVLGLGEQVGGDPGRVVGGVGDDHDLGGAGQGVDADDAVEPALGGGDVGVAGADDLVHRPDRPGAEGQRRAGLRPADAPDLGDAGFARRRQHRRLQLAGRRDHGDAVDAGDLGRHRVHQHGRGIGGPPARHIDPHRLQRRPAPAELDAGLVDEARVRRPLALVVAADARGGEGDRLAHLDRAGVDPGLDLARGDLELRLGQPHPVEALGVAQHARRGPRCAPPR